MKMLATSFVLVLLFQARVSLATPDLPFASEVWDDDEDILDNKDHVLSPLPISYIHPDDLPVNFSWGNVDGISYLTKSLNQHIPQYCGSCWAHSSLSALADRIKIARHALGQEINLSIQYILNCGQVAGTCQGGSMVKVYKFIHETGYVPYDTCAPYLACSVNSTGGFCPLVDTTCSPSNTCRTCAPDGTCRAIAVVPNATVAEYGRYHDASVHAIRAEVFARGPVATAIHAPVLKDYRGGIYNDTSAPRNTTHAVSIVGWGVDDTDSQQPYWVVRNSWGEYWGEMGFFRVLSGHNVIGIESKITWGTPGSFTVVTVPCHQDGSNCVSTQHYLDPSRDPRAIQSRLNAKIRHHQ